MNKVIRSGAREIIYKVYIRCLAEFQAGELLSNLEDVYKRAAEMTGVSESTVRRIAQKGASSGGKFYTPAKHRKGRPSKVLDDFDICAIRQKIHFFYTVKKEVPTIGRLMAVLKEDIQYDGSREHLRKLMKKIGFRYKKCQSNRKALIEKPIIAHKREVYLKAILDNRNLPVELQKNIIYLDESYIHSSYKVKKCWQSIKTEGVTSDISKGKRSIIVHAGSENGFVSNALLIFSGVNKEADYHSEMNKHNFTKWVVEKLIPNITEPSIIVMDNAPYHSVIKNKAPTSANKVDDLRLWLLQNNVQYDPNLRKPSLVALVRKHKPEPVYEIDELLGQYGHTVVRLPPYHCDLNPIELIWAQVKQKVAVQNVDGTNIPNITEQAFLSITSEDWKNCCEHVKKIENEYYERGRTLYKDVDELIIQVGGDESSSEDEYSSESDNKSFDESFPEVNFGASTSYSNTDDVEYLDFDMLDSEG